MQVLGQWAGLYRTGGKCCDHGKHRGHVGPAADPWSLQDALLVKWPSCWVSGLCCLQVVDSWVSVLWPLPPSRLCLLCGHLTFSLALLPPSYKDPCDYISPIYVIQGTFPHLKVLHLTMLPESLLPREVAHSQVLGIRTGTSLRVIILPTTYSNVDLVNGP